MPRVSVLIPAYTVSSYIQQAIESIISQTYTDRELIIIDDCSRDDTWEKVQYFTKQHDKIRAYKNETNQGIVTTRNKLLSLATGEYIALLDSDDRSFPTRLEEQVEYLDAHPECGLCGTNFNVVDSEGNYLYAIQEPETDEEIRRAFWIKTPFGQNTVMMRKNVLDHVGGYDPLYQVAEDLDLWTRIGSVTKLYNIQKILGAYRLHTTNSVRTKQRLMLRNTLKIRKQMRHRGYTPSGSAWIIHIATQIGVWIPAFHQIIITPPRRLTRFFYFFFGK